MDRPSRRGRHESESVALGLARTVLDFLRVVVTSREQTTNLVCLFATATVCLVALIVVIAQFATAPGLIGIVGIAAGATGVAFTIKIRVSWRLYRRGELTDDE